MFYAPGYGLAGTVKWNSTNQATHMRHFPNIACALLFLIMACRSIPTPARIQVPSSLSQQDIEIAILMALDAKRISDGIYDPGVPLGEEEYERLVRQILLSMSGRAWIVEAREEGSIRAILSRPGRYHLRVQVRYDEQQAEVVLVDSQGLRQTGNWIHTKAVGWIRKLEIRIQQNFDRISVAVQRPG